MLKQTEADLRAAPGAWELAFYGGTFTGLPLEMLAQCLDFSRKMLDCGLVDKVRCSTRPDALSVELLTQVKQAGLGLIELGVQSFSAPALKRSARGYTPVQALDGCAAVQAAGLDLGIQLLPGLPGGDPDQFLADVRLALALQPACLRFYPCLVLEGTTLAKWWESGCHSPWSLEQTVAVLGQALVMAWEKKVPVIRLSVAREDSLEAAILAGPRHPALGSSIQAEALRLSVEKALAAFPGEARRIYLPRACQGFMYGHGGCLKDWWAKSALPADRIVFTSAEQAWLE